MFGIMQAPVVLTPHISVMVNGSVILENPAKTVIDEGGGVWKKPPPPATTGVQPTVAASTTSIWVSGGDHARIHALGSDVKGEEQLVLKSSDRSPAAVQLVGLRMVPGANEDTAITATAKYVFIEGCGELQDTSSEGFSSLSSSKAAEEDHCNGRSSAASSSSSSPTDSLLSDPGIVLHPEQPSAEDRAAAIRVQVAFENGFHVSAPSEEMTNETSIGDSDGDFNPEVTILSRRGTIRGVKNHVRASIAALLENIGTKRQYNREELGRVVLYTTSMGVVRKTHDQCRRVRNILHTLMVRFEERDVFMNREYQDEVRERLESKELSVPHVFVEGRLLGNAEVVERLNEIGELRRLLEPYKRQSVGAVCPKCGDFRFLPCTTCGGSKKSAQHRHQFSDLFVALRCMACDENGLIRCDHCLDHNDPDPKQD